MCSKMTEQNCDDLVDALKIVLIKAINAGGSSLKDFKDTGGELGYFQNLFNVYSRENSNCKRNYCKGIIIRKNNLVVQLFFVLVVNNENLVWFYI